MTSWAAAMQVLDHRGERRRVVDELAADLVGDGSVSGSANGVPGSSPRRAHAVSSRHCCGHSPAAGEVRVEAVEHPVAADLFRLRDGQPGRELLDLRFADDRLGGGDVRRVECDEQHVPVRLRREEVGDLVEADDRRGELKGAGWRCAWIACDARASLAAMRSRRWEAMGVDFSVPALTPVVGVVRRRVHAEGKFTIRRAATGLAEMSAESGRVSRAVVAGEKHVSCCPAHRRAWLMRLREVCRTANAIFYLPRGGFRVALFTLSRGRHERSVSGDRRGGFIGSHLVEALMAAGRPVRVFDDFSTGLPREPRASPGAGSRSQGA